MIIVPLTLKQANEFVALHHRHHKPVVGHRFSIGARENGELVGVAICGRPVARAIDWTITLEVTRLCTNGTPNACSKLYSAAARIACEMGFHLIETTILKEESGVSLKASGWQREREIKGRDWNCPSRGGRRTDQPMCDKVVYRKILRAHKTGGGE